MSQYTTPFLVLNLGSEMIFVIAQRLQAQSICQDRATLETAPILKLICRAKRSTLCFSKLVCEDRQNEILSILISGPLIAELTKPQASYSYDAVRSIIEDITQSSIMRLDNHSMDRLWDLITMVFKWQVTMSSDVIEITLRHLYEVETYSITEQTHLQLHKVQNVFENFNKIFTQKEKHQLRDDVLLWLQCYQIRVSLLLRMGLQNEDGSFVYNNTNPIAQEMLKNLGENIYLVTQNGKILEQENQKETETEDKSYELQVFVDQMLGDRKLSTGSAENAPVLKLLIDSDVDKTNEITLEIFDNIDASTRDNALQKIFNDLKLEEDEAQSSIKDELLEIIGNDDE